MNQDQRVAAAWMPACGGTEQPTKTRSGKVLLYCWNRITGEHAYLDVGADVFLTNAEAHAALWPEVAA